MEKDEKQLTLKDDRSGIQPVTGLRNGDALIIVDVQNDFLPGGSLQVPRGDEIIPVINHYIALFEGASFPIIATRDWHPQNHCSFEVLGGPWPIHCVAGTQGAEFPPDLRFPPDTILVSKATTPDKDAYSGLDGTGLDQQLRSMGIKRVFVGGLATDYCVLSTVKDLLKQGYSVVLLKDAVRAVDLHPGDGEKALREMESLGALTTSLEDIT